MSDRQEALSTGASLYVPSIANPPVFPNDIGPRASFYNWLNQPMYDEIRQRFRATMVESDRKRLMNTNSRHIERDIEYIESRGVKVPPIYRECLDNLRLIERDKYGGG